MKSTSTAEAISAQLLALLPQHPAEATVHSVFHTSANLLYQGQLVTLLDDTRPLYPCAVRLGGSIPSVAAGWGSCRGSNGEKSEREVTAAR